MSDEGVQFSASQLFNLSGRGVQFYATYSVSWYSYSIAEAYHHNMNDLSGLCAAVQAFHDSGKNPVAICVYGNEGGHALVGYDLRSVSSTESRLYVYDCNYPKNANRYITLHKNSSGKYVGWYYHLNDQYDWGSSYAKGQITYIPYSVYLSVWNNRAGAKGNAVNLTLNVANATVYDADHDPVATIEDGQLVSARSSVYLVPDIGIMDDTAAQTSSTTSLWLPSDLYIVENEEPGTQELDVALVELEQAVTVSTSARAVTVAIDDSQMLNFAQIDEPGCPYEISMTSTLDGTYADVQLQGTTLDKVLSISQLSGSIQTVGIAKDGKIVVDGIELPLQSVSDDPVEIGGTPLIEPDQFRDVRSTAYYYDSVQWAMSQRITRGTSGSAFSPNATCSRAQVVTFLWRAEGSPEPKSTVHPFTDVKESAFYYKAMLWALENGVTTGVSKTAFAPGKLCTRGQIVTFLWRAEGCPEPKSTTHPFTDIDESGFYFKAMLWAVENGVTYGATSTSFNPTGRCTRAQTVTFLFRFFDRLK